MKQLPNFVGTFVDLLGFFDKVRDKVSDKGPQGGHNENCFYYPKHGGDVFGPGGAERVSPTQTPNISAMANACGKHHKFV